MKPPSKKSRTDLIIATVFVIIGVAILVALGLWQLDRKVWKENLIATLNARVTQAPQDLQAAADWTRFTQSNEEYRRVAFSAEFRSGEEAFVYTSGSAFRPDVRGVGYLVFAPARLADGRVIVVNRGFVPLDGRDLVRTNSTIGPIKIIGVIRWPDRRSMFTPDDEPPGNLWYVRDPLAMAPAKKWDIKVPFYVDQESAVPQGEWPKPGKLQVNLPNDHLPYALTWFGLALGLVSMYGFWLVSRRRTRNEASL